MQAPWPPDPQVPQQQQKRQRQGLDSCQYMVVFDEDRVTSQRWRPSPGSPSPHRTPGARRARSAVTRDPCMLRNRTAQRRQPTFGLYRQCTSMQHRCMRHDAVPRRLQLSAIPGAAAPLAAHALHIDQSETAESDRQGLSRASFRHLMNNAPEAACIMGRRRCGAAGAMVPRLAPAG